MASRREPPIAVIASPVVIDTDVVSYLFKGDSRAESYRRHMDGRFLLISFMTVAELDRWAMARNWGAARRRQLTLHLQQYTVYPYDRALCREWARLTEAARRSGRPIQCADAWIAATATLYGAPLVTHNAGDYAGLSGLTILTETGP
jgi:tRNA(fMet)-specific endonuclease VapC